MLVGTSSVRGSTSLWQQAAVANDDARAIVTWERAEPVLNHRARAPGEGPLSRFRHHAEHRWKRDVRPSAEAAALPK